jgi:hypothetical protein
LQAPTFRARTVPELLDAAFQVVRARFVELILATAAINLPSMAVQLALPEWESFTALFVFLLQNLATAAVVLIVSDAYLGRERGLKGLFRRAFARFGSLVGASVVQTLLIVLGIFLCVVPGVIATIVTFAMPMAVVLEGAGAIDAYRRSKWLARDQWRRIAGSYLLVFLVGIAAWAGVLAVTRLLAGEMVSQVAGVVVEPFCYLLAGVVGTLLYYDLRIRKEAFDIEMLLHEVEALGPAAVPEPEA